jgi:FKBP-type peptidyl-prolyl cis-trans isomerase 2
VTPSACATPARFTAAPCSIRRATVSRTVTLPAEDAYGPHRDDLTLKIGREQLPPEIEPAVGQQLQMNRSGQVFRVTVRDVADDAVVLDANHRWQARI